MNIVNIETFLYIVRCQSLSKAADTLFISQPTASARLKQLEHELGVVLVERDKGERGVHLTDKGRDFVPLAESWLDLNRSTMLFSRENKRTLIKVAAPSSMNLHVLPHIYKRILEQDASLQPQMMAAGSTSVYAAVANREADLGFAYRIVQYANTLATPLFSEDYVLLCNQDCGLPERPIHPRELEPHREVAVASWTGETRRWHDSWFSPYTMPYIQVDNTCHIASFLTVPQTWAICPASIALSFRDQGYPVILRPLSPSPAKHICYFVTRRDRAFRQGDAVKRLLEYVYAYIDATPCLTRLQADGML